jgi:hypothetical protein
MEGQFGNPASTLFSFFSLDGGSQWEDTNMCHSPGLRDGVSYPGTCVWPGLPTILERI